MNEPIIDRTTLENMVATTDAEFVGELIEAFTTDSPQLIAQLRQALADNNAEVFRRAAHSLKSNGASLGAMILSAHARGLEMLGKAGNLTGAGTGVDQLAAEYEQAALALKAWHDNHGA